MIHVHGCQNTAHQVYYNVPSGTSTSILEMSIYFILLPISTGDCSVRYVELPDGPEANKCIYIYVYYIIQSHIISYHIGIQ